MDVRKSRADCTDKIFFLLQVKLFLFARLCNFYMATRYAFGIDADIQIKHLVNSAAKAV